MHPLLFFLIPFAIAIPILVFAHIEDACVAEAWMEVDHGMLVDVLRVHKTTAWVC